jgi:hypothetical protein
MLSHHDCSHQGCDVLIHPDKSNQYYCRHCDRRFSRLNRDADSSDWVFGFGLFALFVVFASLIFFEAALESPVEEDILNEQQEQLDLQG